MFTTFVVQPVFNLLVAIYALLPGHNFGLAIILFTIVIRLLLWPLVKKQLHQTKAMRKIQPELKKIKQRTKGDRQKEMMLTMELYKERGIKPLASIGVLLLQLPILFALFIGLQRVVKDPHEIYEFAYPFLQNLGWMEQLSQNIKLFDETLFGVIDLTRAAVSSEGLYLPALLLVAGSAVIQYFQTKQLMPQAKDARKLREILKEAGEGKQADQSEMNAAISRGMMYFLPIMVFFLTIGFASALGLYWLVGGLVAYIQQTIILRDDETELEAIADEPSKKAEDIPEAEVVATKPSPKPKTKKKSSKSRKKRRK